jgi:SAF domain
MRSRSAISSSQGRVGIVVVESPVRGSGFAAPSAPAQRNRRARWKDGRLVLGVLLVAITALAGAKLLASADDTTAIWAAERDLPAGTKLTDEDLTTVRVRFTSSGEANQYVAADADLRGLVMARAVKAGEFVPRQAAVSQAENDRTELPLSVATGRLPADLAVGDEVDVWVIPKDADQPAKKYWDTVRVVQVDAVKGVSGSSARRQVLIGLEAAEVSRLSAALAAMGSGEPVLVRRSR